MMKALAPALTPFSSPLPPPHPSMEETKLDDSSISGDHFFDALDMFSSPDSDETLDFPDLSHFEFVGDAPEGEIKTTPSTRITTPPVSLRRRRSSSRSTTPRRLPSGDSKDFFCDSLDGSELIAPRDRRNKFPIALKDQAGERAGFLISGVRSDQISGITDQNREVSSREVVAPADIDRSPPSGVLVFVSGLVIKAIWFQLTLLARSVTFPIRLLRLSLLLVTDPFRTLKRARDNGRACLVWVRSVSGDRITSLIHEKLRSLQGVGKLTSRLAWGCFWSFYVCSVLFGCLLTAFLVGRLLMLYYLEEPLQIVEDLCFDYTKASPVALVPISSCRTIACGLDCVEKSGVVKYRGERLIKPNHKLQLTISLVLPESDYNQKLGIFQIKAEFIASDGRVTTSSKRPCMLRYKSSPIRYLETFFKSGPLLTGYSSESQILSLKMTGITEGTDSTACIRITLEQRAEYRPGAGIPEIYAASLRLESELPLLKRIIWNWRKTVFIWTSMGLFSFELLIVLVCCTSIIIPR